MKMKSAYLLHALVGACLLGGLVSLLLWWVNLEVAIQVFQPDTSLGAQYLPEFLRQLMLALVADLSTISTLVPVLLLGFPLVQGWRLLRAQHRYKPLLLEADPYPPQFAFFLVMLGLVGTLYGLIIGLDLSGVSELAGAPLSQDAIRLSLDRLLGGTATALLSSLVGILGAFAAARPMAWLFRKAAGIVPDTSRQGLAETVRHLTEDLTALGTAGRQMAATLGADRIEACLDGLAAQGQAAEAIRAQLTGLNQTLQLVAARLEPVPTMAAALQAVQEQMGGLATQVQTQGNALHELVAGSQAQQRHLAGLEGFASSAQQQCQQAEIAAASRHAEQVAATGAIQASVEAGKMALVQDLSARRKALEAYWTESGQREA